MSDDDNKPKPVDVSKINLDLMKLKVTDVPSILEYAHTVGGFAIVPTEQGQIKSQAREASRAHIDQREHARFGTMHAQPCHAVKAGVNQARPPFEPVCHSRGNE
jgi:hypothetical protein